MATHRIVCHGCAKPFTAKVKHAKWCTPTCQKRQRRAAAAAKSAGKAPEHPLVVRIRAELKAKGVAADDVDGLLAVHLALGIASAETSGKVGPVAAFREARARALGLVEKPTPAAADASEPEPTAQDSQLAQILTMAAATRAAIGQ